MAKSNTELSDKIASKKPAKFEQLQIQEQLSQWRDKHVEKLAALAGNKDAAEKIFVICMNTIGKNPDLMQCTFESIANCILQSFQLNLFPGAFQECGYVPLKNGRLTQLAGREVKEANFWPQYQGLVKLLRNAGNKAVIARVVCENDHFEYREGLEAPVYIPAVCLKKKRGSALFVYSAVLSPQGGWQVEVMDLDQINVIKSRSQGAKKSDSPWNSKHIDDQYTMWAKTCLKRVSKWCAKSAELVMAIESDNVVDGDPTLLRASARDLLGNSDVPLALPQAENSEATEPTEEEKAKIIEQENQEAKMQ